MNKFAFALVLFLVPTIYAQQPTSSRQERQPLTRVEPERAAKAQELLGQARAALGQGNKFDSLTTLSASGKVQRAAMTMGASAFGAIGTVALIGGDVDPSMVGATTAKEHFVSGKVEYDFSLPDKFRWQENTDQFRRLGFLDGERAWVKNNDRVVPIPTPRYGEIFRQQYAYIPLGLLLTAPPGLSLEFTYVGERPFRQDTVDVIAITGAGAFKTELYLDQKNHLPILLRFVIGAMNRPAMAFMPPGTSQAEGRRAIDVAKAQADAKPPGQQEREKLILLEDYRAVDGILLPHKITTQINGKLVEEILFSKFKVNQPIKAEKFAEKQ